MHGVRRHQTQLQRPGPGADAHPAVHPRTAQGDFGYPGLDRAPTSLPLVVRLDHRMSQPFGPVGVLPVHHVSVHIGIPMVHGDKQFVFWHYRTIGKISPECSSSARITTMISYAQNQEDVILDRALHSPTGFYVDVGAASPSIASVTRHFYEMGWSRHQYRAQESYVAELRLQRPRDLSIQAAAGAVPGTCTFHVVDSNRDLSTYDDSRVADLASEGEPTTTQVVEVVTLDDVLDRAQAGAIDFLKIDVEGAERDVLLGIDLTRWRPRVLVVESTVANTQIPNYGKWEDLVVGRGYVFASSDGINRYYVPKKRCHSSIAWVRQTARRLRACLLATDPRGTRAAAGIYRPSPGGDRPQGRAHHRRRRLRPSTRARGPTVESGPTRLRVVRREPSANESGTSRPRTETHRRFRHDADGSAIHASTVPIRVSGSGTEPSPAKVRRRSWPRSPIPQQRDARGHPLAS